MATQRQIDANRRNGARSKGPVTAEGKEKSSRNSATHGLSAQKIFVLANESPQVFDNLLAGFIRHYQPATELEHELCLNIAHAHWRIRRLAIIETGMFDREMQRQAKEIDRRERTVQADGTLEVEEGIRLASAFEGLAKENGALGLLSRYEGRLQRTFHSLVERLEAVQKKRQNEPNLTGLPAVNPPSLPPELGQRTADGPPLPSFPEPTPLPAPVPAPVSCSQPPPLDAPVSPLDTPVSPSSPPVPIFFEYNPSLAASQKGAKLVSQQF